MMDKFINWLIIQKIKQNQRRKLIAAYTKHLSNHRNQPMTFTEFKKTRKYETDLAIKRLAEK